MRYRNSFEDQIRSKLENHSPEVPGHIWENISRKKDKRRPFFFLILDKYPYLSAFTALMIIGSGILFAVRSAQSSGKISLTKIPTTHSQLSSANLATANSIKDVAENNYANSVSTTSQDQSDAHMGILNNHKVNNEDNSISTISIKNSVESSPKSSSAASLAQKTSQKNIAVFSNKRANNSSNVKQTATAASSVAAYSNSEAETIETPIEESIVATMVDKMTLIEKPFTFRSHLVTPNHTQSNIPCPVPRPSTQRSYLDFYVSPDYVLREFRDTPNSSYLTSRKESTKFSSAYSFGMGYTKVFSNGINLRAGVNYSQINEKLSYSEGNIIQDVFIVNANGDTIGSYQTVSTKYKTTYNKYKTLDIPLTIGYEMTGNKWDVNFTTGIIVNIHSWNQGTVLNSSLQPVNIGATENNPYTFKTNIGIGGTAGASFCYKWREKAGLFVQPYLRYNFSTMNKEEISLKQKYHTSGIRLGLRLKL